MSVYCWSSVADAGPTMNQHRLIYFFWVIRDPPVPESLSMGLSKSDAVWSWILSGWDPCRCVLNLHPVNYDGPIPPWNIALHKTSRKKQARRLDSQPCQTNCDTVSSYAAFVSLAWVIVKTGGHRKTLSSSSRHSTRCWVHDGPESKTMGQHESKIVWTFRVYIAGSKEDTFTFIQLWAEVRVMSSQDFLKSLSTRKWGNREKNAPIWMESITKFVHAVK